MRCTWILATLTGFAACLGPELTTLETEPLVINSAAPEVGFDEGDVLIVPGPLSGWVVDPDQAASTVPLTLTSDRAGLLWRGNANGAGNWTWEGEIEPGPHELTIEATDREGNTTQQAAQVTVRGNSEPRCRVTSPTAGAVFTTRESIHFEVDAFDADGDPLFLLWRSSIQGSLFEGRSFDQRLSQPGEHIISVTAMDEIGEPCVDEVLILVQ